MKLDDYSKLMFMWREAMILVGVDLLRPVWRELGLSFRFEESMRGLARDFVERRWSGAGVEKFGQPYFEGYYKEDLVPMLDSCACISDLDRRALLDWVYHTFQYSEGNPWYSLYEIMTTWRAQFARQESGDLGLGGKAAELAAALKSYLQIEGVERAIRLEFTQGLSRWDTYAAGVLCMTESDFAGGLVPFFDRACLVTRMARFRLFWGSLENEHQFYGEGVKQRILAGLMTGGLGKDLRDPSTSESHLTML